ncbi:MAG: hypothetical protein R3C01_17735 [Planctomycetaceae bacterium]
MFGVKTLLFGLTIGAGGMFAADRYHLVNTPDGYVVIPRVQSPALLDSYANVRGWGTEQWSRNIPLSQAIVAGGRGDLISEGIRSDLLRQASEGLGLTQGSNGQELEARTLQHSPNAGSAGAPEIIFGQSVSETRPSPPATSGGSLLDRLQQQLQSNPLNSKATSNKAGVPSASQGGVTGAGWSDFQERPLTRDIVPNSTYGSSIPASVPRQPTGSSIPTGFQSQPGQPVPTTTSVGTSSLPQFQFRVSLR